jgi:hypothetical protein
MPDFSHKVYAGDPNQAAIVRAQEGELILCSDPRFQAFRCVHRDDYFKIYDGVLKCKKW